MGEVCWRASVSAGVNSVGQEGVSDVCRKDTGVLSELNLP